MQIVRIQIEGLRICVSSGTQKAGWQQQFGGESITAASHARGASQSETLADPGGALIKDSRLSYQDVLADHVNLDVGHVIAGIGMPVRVKLQTVSDTSRRIAAGVFRIIG